MSKLANLAFVVFFLFTTACANVHISREVSVDAITKEPPFIATVEKIVVQNRLVFKPDIYIYLRVSNGGDRLALTIISASDFELGFAKYLHKGGSYTFPQIITDYVNSQKTNQ